MNAQDIIRKLDLKPLPMEGGYYRETYRSEMRLPGAIAGVDSSETRNASTAIYFLVTPTEFSSLHKIKYDEIFHFYAGDAVEMIQFGSDGSDPKTIRLGPDILGRDEAQVIVPAHIWQGLKLAEGGRFALLGTTVAPGFDFKDFEIGTRADLSRQFPHLRKEIERYTHP